MAVIIKEKERSEGYLLILEQLKASIVNVAELAVKLYERGKSEGLSNKLIRADIEEALQGIIQERRLRQILPLPLKRAYNITSVNSEIDAELACDSASRAHGVALPNGVKLILGDCTETDTLDEKIPDSSIDLIFTDPPYNMESVPLYSKLGELAMRVLKPGASLVTYFGQYALPEIIQRLTDSGLKYNWIPYVKHGGINTFMCSVA